MGGRHLTTVLALQPLYGILGMKHGPEAMAQRGGSLNLWFCWPLGTSGPSTAWLVARSSGVSKPIEKPPQLQIIPLFVPNGCGPMEVTIGASAMPSRKAVQVPMSKRPVASLADAHAALLCCLTGQAVLSLRSQQHPPNPAPFPPMRQQLWTQTKACCPAASGGCCYS